MAADAHTANHSPLCRRQCQQYNVRRMRTARPFGRQLRCNAEVAEADVGPSTSSETAAVVDFDSEASTAEVPKSDTWELDFSSRPILDSRGKKRWELLITSPDRSWVYSKWFPNNKINSTQVCPSSAIMQPCHWLACQVFYACDSLGALPIPPELLHLPHTLVSLLSCCVFIAAEASTSRHSQSARSTDTAESQILQGTDADDHITSIDRLGHQACTEQKMFRPHR